MAANRADVRGDDRQEQISDINFIHRFYSFPQDKLFLKDIMVDWAEQKETQIKNPITVAYIWLRTSNER